MVSCPISTAQAARWFIAHFGMDLPPGERWLWVQGAPSAIGGYMIAGDEGLEGIINYG